MANRISRRDIIETGTGIFTCASVIGAASATESVQSQETTKTGEETKSESSDTTFHPFDYVSGSGGSTSVYGEGKSSGNATPGYLRCSTNNEGINVSRTTVETFTEPIRREVGIYEIQFDWRLNGERTSGANMLARVNLWKGEEAAKILDEPTRTELLSSATRATASYSTSGKAVLKTEVNDTVGTVLSLELKVITTAQMTGAETGEFELYVPQPDACNDESQATHDDESNDNGDNYCNLPRRVSVRPT
jgi:hypothetical protein